MRNITIAVVLLVVGATVGVPTVAAQSSLTVSTDAEDAQAGETTTLTITVENTGSEARAAIVVIDSLPDDWSIENHSDDGGTWNEDEQKWLFQSIEAGDSVSPSVTLAVPEDASGEHDIDVRAQTNSGNVTTTATVAVEGSGGSGGSSPGFGAVVAVLALLAVGLIAGTRRD